MNNKNIEKVIYKKELNVGEDNKYEEFVEGNKYLEVTFHHGDGEKNGAFVEDLVSVAIARLEHYNKLNPCRENEIAMQKLEEAILWLDYRQSRIESEKEIEKVKDDIEKYEE